MIMPWKYIIPAILIVGAVIFSALPSHAKPILIGTFDEVPYYYDDSSIVYDGNIRVVWVGTTDKKFNYTDDKDYAGAAGRFAIDCSGHSSVFVEGYTFDKKGIVIQNGKVPESKWTFVPIMNHTPQYSLYRILCADHPII
jgi:hypothetical protein